MEQNTQPTESDRLCPFRIGFLDFDPIISRVSGLMLGPNHSAQKTSSAPPGQASSNGLTGKRIDGLRRLSTESVERMKK